MTSELPDGWTRRRLADCGTWLSGGTPSKSRPEYWGGEIPWVGPKDLHVRYVEDAEERLTEIGAANGTRLVPENTILIVVRSMALAKRLQIAFTCRQVAFNQDIKAILPADGVRPRFLFYALWGCHDALHALVDEASHGTKRLRTEVLVDYLMPIPPASEQERIEMVLAALDDKIDSNRRLAGLLEQVAATMFRARFVEFVGVEEFEESEIGRIPRGWRIGPLGVLVDVTMGQSPPGSSYSEDPEDGPLLVQGRGGFGERYPKSNVYTSAPTRQAQAGATLMTVRAPVGAVNVARTAVCLGRGVAGVESKHPAFAEFLIRSLENRWASQESGTIFPAVNREQVLNLQVPVPPPEDVVKFERLAAPLVAKLAALRDEAEVLTNIRDALLPKLVSGEISVPDTGDPDEVIEPAAEQVAA